MLIMPAGQPGEGGGLTWSCCRTCLYPRPVSSFDLGSYLGTWYQVAGYEAVFTAGCKCVTASYALNDDGTVGVTNQCEALGLPVSITGSAAPVDRAYGEAGALDVTLFNSTNACPGPNYIVQGGLPPQQGLGCRTGPAG